MREKPLFILTESGKQRLEQERGALNINLQTLVEEAPISPAKLSEMRQFKPVGEFLIQKVFQRLKIKDAKTGVDYLPYNSRPAPPVQQRDGSDIQPKLAERFSAAGDDRPFNVPYQRNPFFQGRGQELAVLHERLTESHLFAIGQTQAIGGLGGIGKTQTAVEYAYRYRGDYDAVFWIGADTEQEIGSGYVGIARLLALPEADAPEQATVILAAMHWLEREARWLLILDNADAPETLAPYLSNRPKGHILITTRRERLDRLNIPAPLRLDTLSPQDGRTFFLKRCDRLETTYEEKRAAGDLANALGNLPLAMEQAAAYIVQKQATFANYLALYKKRELDQLEKSDPVTGKYSSTVGFTWDINFDAIEAEAHGAKGASRHTAALLELCAFLAPDNIPSEIVLDGAKVYCPEFGALVERAADKDECLELYDAILEPLTHYSLIIKKPASQQFGIHRLVQAVLRGRLSEEGREAVIQRAVETVNAIFPSGEPETWAVCERLVEHSQTLAGWIKTANCPSATAVQLLSKLGYFLLERGQSVAAEPLYEEALAIRRLLKVGPLDIALGIYDLGVAYYMRQSYSKAQPLFEEALNIRRQCLPLLHHDISSCLGMLSVTYSSQRIYDNALLLMEEALSILRQTLPPGDLSITDQNVSLAILYAYMGLYDKSIFLLEEALEVYVNHSSKNIQKISNIMINLGKCYSVQRIYDKALPLLEEALTIRRVLFPANHPDIAITLHAMGNLYRDQQLYDKALPFYEEASAILRTARLPNYSARTLNDLAASYKAQAQWEEAEPVMAEALEEARRAFPNGNPMIAEYEATLEEIRAAIRRERR